VIPSVYDHHNVIRFELERSRRELRVRRNSHGDAARGFQVEHPTLLAFWIRHSLVRAHVAAATGDRRRVFRHNAMRAPS